MNLNNLDINNINDLVSLKNYYHRINNLINSLFEELYLESDYDALELKSEFDYLNQMKTRIMERFCELQNPTLSDGIIDLYRYRNNRFIITEHNQNTPIGNIEYYEKRRAIPGNISYEIFDNYRGHHYALRALNLIGRLLLNQGVSKIYITASSEKNYPSIKTIESFGGERFHKEDYVTGPIPYTCDLERIYSK